MTDYIKQETFLIPGASGRNMLADLTFDIRNREAPLVIFAHGFKGFKDWGTHNLVARYFAEYGFRFLKFNFSHNGTTPEHPLDFVDLEAFSNNTFSKQLEDLKLVIDFATNGSNFLPVKTVFLIGHSKGGGISIIKTAEDERVKKLITWASVADFHNLWPKEAEAQWRLTGKQYFINSRTNQQLPVKATLLDDLGQNQKRLNIFLAAAEIKQPWLIVHGDTDPTVNISHALELKDKQPNAELVIVPEANHTFNSAHPYFEDVLPAALKEVCEKCVEFLRD
ncbi:alpha/beta hydrolase family protein [Mucilaginibacter arboris]|uniref:Alpha/beta fold hydrolase n=1 Tax=Mucilaginibacter arboris TaxID=2682090 RepID=A0A7K1STE0_9SPHI|nr:alpha/beta fold hydrolase [Mucilaginibacter arboris]MVN20576.1 alpha/beta fold hydrolase [Mucilaginibacter arboris]